MVGEIGNQATSTNAASATAILFTPATVIQKTSKRMDVALMAAGRR